MDWLNAPVWRLAVALAIGLLIGAERERRKGAGPGRASAGVRTFALAALLGGVGAQGGPVLLGVLALALAALALLAYARSERQDPGLTSEVALLLGFALGALAQGEPGLALGAGVAVTALLAARTALHTFVRDTLSAEELRDALVLGTGALVVLPLLPDRALGPLGILNPFALWRLAVVLMAINAFGYVLRRAAGARYGPALSGLASGFVSSLATVAAMGARARAGKADVPGAVAGAAASSVATFVQAAALIGAVSPAVLATLAWPLGLGGLGALAGAALATWRAAQGPTGADVPRGRAFDVRTALGFAALVSLVAALAALAGGAAGPAGALLTAALAGLADGHAAAASVATLGAAGRLSAAAVTLGVALALSTNTLMKAVVAHASGPRAYAWAVTLGLAALLAGVWGGAALALWSAR